MKHGLITKIEKKFMIIKTDDGDIERLKIRKNIQIGGRISFEKRDIYRGFNRISYTQVGTSLSMLIILAVIGYNLLGQLNENKVFAVVSYDVNPSFLIEINEDKKVLTVESKDGFDNLIPDKYNKQSLTKVLNDITDNVVEANLLRQDDIILLSYVSVSDEAKDLDALQDFINAKKNRYQVVLITSDQTYLEESNNKDLSVGRQYLLESLDTNNIQVADSDQFVQDAVEALELIRENEKGYTEIDTSTPIIPDSSETTIKEEQSEISIDDASETDDTTSQTEEETIDEETIKDEEEQSDDDKKAIEAQKAVTDDAYQTYLDKKAARETAKRNLDYHQSQINEKTAEQENYQNRYTDILNGEKEFINEKNTLEYRINVEKVNLLNEALIIRDETVEDTHSDQELVDIIKADADAIYNDAYTIYKPIADSTISHLQQLKEEKQELLNNPPSTVGINTNGITAEIEELDQMISEVENQTNPLSPELTANSVSQDVIATYNDAYTTFDLERQKRNNLYSRANKLQKEINTIIIQADEAYNNRVMEIEELYSEDPIRIEEIQTILDGFQNVKPKFETNIQEMSDTLVIMKDELTRLKNLYEQAKQSEDDAYDIYIKEKELLDQLENKE